MKRILKILALTVAVIMIFSCFAGCKQKKVVKTLTPGGSLITDSSGSNSATNSDGDVNNNNATQPKKPNSAETKKSAELSYEEQSKIAETISSYFYSVAKLDPDYTLNFVDPSSDLYQEVKDSMVSLSAEAFGMSEEDFSALGTHIFWNSEHQVVDIEFDGVEAVATVDISMPNFNNFDPTTDTLDDIPDLDKIEDTAKLTLEKIDNEWLVTKDE